MPVFKEIPAEVTGHVPVKIWTDQVEESAEQQLTALAGCPFIFHHVAAMPDVHFGLGATIGSVFATEGALLPTAVGVDIGCFTGDTLIPLLDGTERSLKELAETDTECWVWAITPSHRVTATKASAKKTRSDAPLVRVTLDNGQAIRCTPDHQFMLRNGEWIEAIHLAPGTSLMPLYKQVDHDGYVMICQPYSGRWQRTHWAVARTGALGEIPRAVIREKIENDPEFLAKKITVGTENIVRSMQEHPDEWKAAVTGNGERGKGLLVAYNQSEKGRPKSREVGSRDKEPLNHQVICVEVLDEHEDVYCLTVPHYGNFALSAGVFVHNCGMLAQPFEVRAMDLSQSFLRELHEVVKRDIPTGFGQHDYPQEWEGFDDETRYTDAVAAIVRKKGPLQLGSLGGGNHFLELCKDEDDRVWLMLHSGSRGAGNMIASHHIAIAQELNTRLGIPSARDLWVLPLEREESQNYLRDMLWAQDYAMENRQRMRWDFIKIFGDLLRKRLRIDLQFDPDAAINIHHNYASLETHFGCQVWIHRKGATFAGPGVLGIIPGSMATGSYIVRGLGNPESFMSCSHGAGRVMSRGEAVRSITLESFAHKMKGIVAETGKEYLDEAPQAYKDLDTVLMNQADLVEPVRRLQPIMNVKGAGKPRKDRDRTRDRDDPVQQRKAEQRKRRH